RAYGPYHRHGGKGSRADGPSSIHPSPIPTRQDIESKHPKTPTMRKVNVEGTVSEVSSSLPKLEELMIGMKMEIMFI
ncbi:MAG: hypothetical protein ABGZ17_28320, partial [Planctomycetaceae bacterium]